MYFQICCQSPPGYYSYLSSLNSKDPKRDIFIWIWDFKKAMKFSSRKQAEDFILFYKLYQDNLIDLHISEVRDGSQF